MYKRREKIGQGWLGPLYSGEDASGRVVRLIPLQKCSISWLEEVRQRHRLMSSRLVHRALPSLGIHSIGGEPYWVGGWRNGVNLATAIEQHRIPYSVMIAIAQQVVTILLEAKTVGIVHGDLQPQAIWLTANGEVWIDGFGQPLGKSEVTTRTSEQYYTSPSGKISSTGDVYSLGIILLETFVNKDFVDSGLDEDEHQEILKAISVQLKIKNISKSLISLILKMLTFSDQSRIGLDKLARKWVQKTPELSVHSWLQANYPMIYTSGAPEQKIAYVDFEDKSDSGEYNIEDKVKDKVENRDILFDELGELDTFGKELDDFDLFFQNASMLPDFDNSFVKATNDVIEFEKTAIIGRDRIEDELFELEEASFNFDDAAFLEGQTLIDEEQEFERTEMLGNGLSIEDSDPFVSEDEFLFDEETQAVQLFDDETAEEFFSSDVTQQLFSDDTQEIFWTEKKEKKRSPLQYVAFVLVIIILIFTGLYGEQFLLGTKDNSDTPVNNTKAQQTKITESVAPDKSVENSIEVKEVPVEEIIVEEVIVEEVPVEEVIVEEKVVEEVTRVQKPLQPIKPKVVLPPTPKRVISVQPKKTIPKQNTVNTAVKEAAPETKEIDPTEAVWSDSTEKPLADSIIPAEDVPKKVIVKEKAKTGTVLLVGDVEKLTLVRNGKPYSLGELNVGVYQIRVTFDGLPITTAGRLNVEDGKISTIYCDAGFASCRVD